MSKTVTYVMIVYSRHLHEYSDKMYVKSMIYNKQLMLATASLFSGNYKPPHLPPELIKCIYDYIHIPTITRLETEFANDIYKHICKKLYFNCNLNKFDFISKVQNFINTHDYSYECKAYINKCWIDIYINYDLMYKIYLKNAY